MQIVKEFKVAADAEAVWEFFQDVPRVAACLPGAELTGAGDDGSYEGRVTFKLGPMTAAFEGTAVLEAETSNRSARMVGRGRDKKGGSRGKITTEYRIVPSGPECLVEFEADVTLQGPVAQIGRQGLIDEVASRLIDDFVSCVEATLQGSPDTTAVAVQTKTNLVGLLASSVWAMFKRLFTRLGRRNSSKS